MRSSHTPILLDQPFLVALFLLSARILALEAHATSPPFTWRHRWRAGDLIMWDNRCLLHRADANFDLSRHRRVLHRTCLKGTPTEGQRIAREPLHAAAGC